MVLDGGDVGFDIACASDFAKGADLSRWSAAEIAAAAAAINNRPKEILDWRTPAEAFEEQLRSTSQTTVATTG